MLKPHLILDIDGVLQAPRMKYGYEQHRVIEERIPIDMVHPALRPRQMREARRTPKTVPFRTHVRVSRRLFEDLEALDLHVVMLTTWLEHESARAFLDQSTFGREWFPSAVMLPYPGRADDGSQRASWKVDALRALLAADPRPFIWADDDEVPIWRATISAEFAHIPHLLVAPDSAHGLSRADVAAFSSFARDHG